MSSHRIHMLLLSALTGLAGDILATETTLPPILVSATRSEREEILIPASITVITRQEIDKYQTRKLSEILQFRGGIQLDDPSGNGESATIDMRGFGPTAGSNTLILVDGRRLNNSSDASSPDLNSIDPSNIERIEIIQGSAGTLFGNQAVGGMINIVTRKPQAFEARLMGGVGDYAGYRIRGEIGDRLSEGLSYRLSAHQSENDNYRDNSETDRKGLNLRTDLAYAGGNLFFEYQYLDDYQALPGSLFADELTVDRQQSIDVYAGDFSHTYTHVGRLGLSQDLTRHWTFEGEMTCRDNQRDFQSSFRGFPGAEATQDRRVGSLNPRFLGAYSLAAGELLITTGADFEQTDYELRTSFGPQLLDQEIQAYYAQVVLPISPRWSATTGIRHAKIENTISNELDPAEQLDDEVTVGSLGTVFKPTPEWRLFLRADQNYRFATVDEHTNVVHGQPVGIRNQTGTSYETGIAWSRAAALAKLVVYRLDLQDEISFDASSYSNTNLDQTRRQGAILEAQWPLTPQLLIGGSFTYTDPKITDGEFEGKRIPLASARTARLFTDWDMDANWSLLTEALYASERVLGGDFTNRFEPMDGYTRLNTSLSFDQAPWRLSLKINNLLDEKYNGSGAVGYDETFTLRDAYFPASGRNAWLSMEYRFE